MFEKDAEEHTKKNFCGCCPLTWKNQCKNFVNCGYHDSWKDGAEFGYNKANEWHYVKNGDLPKDDKQYLVLFYYNYKGKKEMLCGVRDNLHSDFENLRCYTEQIIAWKEIVLPKESE